MPGSNRRHAQEWNDDPSRTWTHRHRLRNTTTARYEVRPYDDISHEDIPPALHTVLAAAERCIMEARAAETEYRRALDDFQRLMSHRIANPLQVIVGMVDTLLLMPDLEAPRRIAFLSAISEQAHVLRDVSTTPRVSSRVESDLRPDVDCRAVRRFDRSASRLAQAVQTVPA